MVNYFNMLHQHGLMAVVPYEEFIELLEFKLNSLKEAKERDSSWNYRIEELESEINKIKGFKQLLIS